MSRPKLEQPNYGSSSGNPILYPMVGSRGWKRVSTGTDDRRQAQIFLAQFIAGVGTPQPPPTPTVAAILEGYLADRKTFVRHYERLYMAAKPLPRHLGDLVPDHLTKERIRFYRRRARLKAMR